MIILLFFALTLLTLLLLTRFKSGVADAVALLHPFLYFFIFTEFIYEFDGPDAMFYPFGYVTLCLPLAFVSGLMRWGVLQKPREQKKLGQ